MALTPTAAKLVYPPFSIAQIPLFPSLSPWLTLCVFTILLSSYQHLLSLRACGCAQASTASVYLSKLPISAYCPWKPRKLITKLIMVPGVEYMACVCARVCEREIWKHTQTLCHSPPPSPHVMPVTWFPGKQLSKSESDFYF